MKRQVIEMKINRIHKIQELLEDVHSVSINTLCETFQVSKNTIRRDIAELEKSGMIKKVYGGIVLQEKDSHSPEPFASRENRNTQQKKRLPASRPPWSKMVMLFILIQEPLPCI